MFATGQEVMIVGDSRCPIGQVVNIREALPCDLGDRGMTWIYQVSPPVMLLGLEVYFQPRHLMPLSEEPIILEELLHLEA